MKIKPKMRPVRKWILWTSLSLTVILVAIIGYYSFSVYKFAHNIQADSKESRFDQFQTGEQNETAPPKWEGKEKVNILLLGGDERDLRPNEVPRSDSMMLLSVDPITKKGYLFSILRDTYVKIPGHGQDRINAALAIGGPNLAMKTVSELLDVPVQYYVYTNFEGFISLVDAVGGIDFEVEKDMKWTDSADDHKYDIDLKKGVQHLDGKTALQYVRFRHDALSDFTRTERQRNFLQAIAQKMQDTTSLLKIPKILESITPYIETNLTISDMIKLASLGYESKATGLVSVQIPPQGLVGSANIGGAEVLTADERKLKGFVEDVLIGIAPDEAAVLAGKSAGSTTAGNTGGRGSSSSGRKSSSGSGATSGGGTGTKKPSVTESAAGHEPSGSTGKGSASGGKTPGGGATTPDVDKPADGKTAGESDGSGAGSNGSGGAGTGETGSGGADGGAGAGSGGSGGAGSGTGANGSGDGGSAGPGASTGSGSGGGAASGAGKGSTGSGDGAGTGTGSGKGTGTGTGTSTGTGTGTGTGTNSGKSSSGTSGTGTGSAGSGSTGSTTGGSGTGTGTSGGAAGTGAGSAGNKGGETPAGTGTNNGTK